MEQHLKKQQQKAGQQKVAEPPNKRRRTNISNTPATPVVSTVQVATRPSVLQTLLPSKQDSGTGAPLESERDRLIRIGKLTPFDNFAGLDCPISSAPPALSSEVESVLHEPTGFKDPSTPPPPVPLDFDTDEEPIELAAVPRKKTAASVREAIRNDAGEIAEELSEMLAIDDGTDALYQKRLKLWRKVEDFRNPTGEIPGIFFFDHCS